MFSTKPLLLLAASFVWSEWGLSAAEIEVPGVVISVIEQVDVPARQRGPLTSFAVEEGDSVDQGQLLAGIADDDARLALARAQLELDSAREEAHSSVKIQLARKALKLAESELARGQRSRERFRDSISDEEIEDRQLKVERAQLEIEQAELEQRLARNRAQARENDLRMAERQLELHRVVAPLAGIIVQVNRRDGEWVEPGESVLKILRVNRLRAEGFVKASELLPQAAGQPVKLAVESSSGSREFAGLLKFVSPEINAVDGRVRIWAEIENVDLSLRPGMRGSLWIGLSADRDPKQQDLP